jgi:hypothetical protein
LQRLELLLLAALAAVVGAALLQTHGEVVQHSKVYTAETCPVPLTGPEQGCLISMSRLYLALLESLPWFNVLPLLAAVLLALPIVSELEGGTYRLAWTQGITRGRWARTKLGLLALSGLAFAAIFSLTFHWWASPLDQHNGRLARDDYDLRGLLPIGYTLFAVGLVLAVGVLLRRPVPAVILAFLAYVGIRIPVMLWVRPRLVTPVTQSMADYSQTNPGNVWWLSFFWRDAAGNRLSEQQSRDLCFPNGLSLERAAYEQCVVEHGLTPFVTYHPDSHYWPLQLAETGLFLAAGLALIAFAAWYLLRRVE